MFWHLIDQREHAVIPAVVMPKGVIPAQLVPGPLRYEAFDRYALRHGYVGGNYDFAYRVIRTLDSEYRKLRNERKSP